MSYLGPKQFVYLVIRVDQRENMLQKEALLRASLQLLIAFYNSVSHISNGSICLPEK